MVPRSLATRLFVDTPLASGMEIALGESHSHQLRNVLRLAEGDLIALFNGRDGEWSARLAALAKRSVTIIIGERLRPQPTEPDVWLLFAPIKGPRIDWLVEKAAELGATEIRPVLTRRTVVSRVNRERLQAHAVEAAEQCERLTAPAVRNLESLETVVGAWPKERHLYVAAERRGAVPMAEAIRADGAPAAILIGPEGGFDPAELDHLAQTGFASLVDLGPRILRADTAAVAAMALWQALAQPPLAGRSGHAHIA
ncbi:MAG: 16S rRNA (uracil(1498)-N(3))-methyltransferase [Alphaproteobacteria bacterium]|nr:16S rRNA (uracil(1498)-N(3))-methyltransferase [Alphaproteobacteria bacterium]